MKRKLAILLAALALAFGIYYATTGRRREIVLTGIVTTDEVIVSSEIQGRLQELHVREGDKVRRGDLLGLIRPQEWQADMSFYTSSE